MTRRTAFFALSFAAALAARTQRRYPVRGLVLTIDRRHRTFVVSCTAIPGYMEAMVMPLSVRDPAELDGIAQGSLVDFTLVVTKSDSYAAGVRIHRYQSGELEPVAAGRLQTLSNLANAGSGIVPLAVGSPVPDFTLTDQEGRPVKLSQFTGQVIAAAFIYTRCPLPNYCFRLSNNLGQIRKRFAEHMGRGLILLTITMDPEHDIADVMAKYAATWKADGTSWRFLTGPPADVRKVCRQFGVNFWADEGTLTHSLHTILIDRQGKLAANLEGNEFTAAQLGDLVDTLLGR